MNMRHARIKEAIESFDETVEFDRQLVGAHNRAVKGRVECGSIASSGENANSFHSTLYILRKSAGAPTQFRAAPATRRWSGPYSPPRRGGVAAPVTKMPRSLRSGADGVVVHNETFRCERPPRPLL